MTANDAVADADGPERAQRDSHLISRFRKMQASGVSPKKEAQKKAQAQEDWSQGARLLGRHDQYANAGLTQTGAKEGQPPFYRGKMSGPEAIVHERVAKWRPMLLSGQPVKEMFPAGKAQVSADVRTGAPGDVNQGIRVLEQRLVAAVNAAQESHFVTEVRVRPDENLGLNAVVKVSGPDD